MPSKILKLMVMSSIVSFMFNTELVAKPSEEELKKLEQQWTESFEQEMVENTAKFFQIPASSINLDKIDSLYAEKELIFYQQLAKCNPGEYRFGAIDMLPFLVQATVKGVENEKCIVNYVITSPVSLPHERPITMNCAISKENFGALVGASLKNAQQIMSNVSKNECQQFIDGKLIPDSQK